MRLAGTTAGLVLAVITSATQPPSNPNQVPRQNPGTPTTNPGQQPGTPGQQPTTNPSSNPNRVLPSPGINDRELMHRRLFALENPGSETRLNEVGQKLERAETQLNEANERLLTQLGQARQLTGDRRADAMSEVMQEMLQQQVAMQKYLKDLRMAVTGDVAMEGDMNTPSSHPTPTPKSNPPK
jgi:hypothetical protein